MAYTEGLCPKIQTNILRVFGNNAPTLKRRKLGLVQMLKSSYNTSGFEQLQPSGGVPGKKRGIVLTYQDAYCETAAKVARDCVVITDQEPQPKEIVIDVDENPWQMVDGTNKPLSLMFDENEMKKLCENDAQFMSDNVYSWMARMTDNIDKSLLAVMAANWGKFADGSTQKSIPLFANQAGVSTPLRSAVHVISNSYNDIVAPGTPIVIGGNLFNNYNRDTNGACCNNFGVQMDTKGEWYYFNDQYADSIWGTDQFGVFAPGAVQFVTWSRYKGREKDNDIFSRGTIVDPFTGLEFDFKILYDPSCEKWRVNLYLYGNLEFVPGVACGLTDVNNTLNFAACAEAESFTCV